MRSITITALDIGTSSVKGLCCKKNLSTGEIQVLGQVSVPCFGVRNGEVVRPEAVAAVISQAKNELSQQAGVKIKEAIINLGGTHLFPIVSQGLVSVSRADQKISYEDIQRVLKAAHAIHLPSNKEILEAYPKEFLVDGESNIKNPIDLQGIRLEARVLLICYFKPVFTNLMQALLLSNLEKFEIKSSFLAAARAVLTAEQKELGVLLIEIGAGTTSVAVFEKGELVDFMVFPIGSANITNDIALFLRTEIQTAEQIKKDFGSLVPQNKEKQIIVKKRKKSGKMDNIEDGGILPFASEKEVRRIVEMRIAEICLEIQKNLKKLSSGQPLPAGIVLTGGGANIEGIVGFMKEKFKLPCRMGKINIKDVNDAQFAVCCGLVSSVFEQEGNEVFFEKESAIHGFKKWLLKVFRVFLP